MNFSIGSFSFLTNKKPAPPAPLKLPHTDPDAVGQLSDRLRHIFAAVPAYQPIVVVCVGTDRSTGDALGPLVGSSLHKHSNIPVYGTLDEPVHAVNLTDRLEEIQRSHRNPFIVAIDACLGQLSSVGCIQAGDGPVKPGAGVNKELPPVGDYHVTGIVNVGGFMEYFVLQNTRLSLVVNMADVISESIRLAAEERFSSSRASASLE
ncbi:spore protease YyaC [Paenibacillus antri]|uniref:Spore protease YyaC n=1 Tax=Paenibacillus antri TaxID=2582848 RepID=A0A5R9G1J1_9BACL|nr:spore protease YyaC [Paenibacillus antri]TLS48879.1 spore protease YyaC [Paenibacillus antri]